MRSSSGSGNRWRKRSSLKKMSACRFHGGSYYKSVGPDKIVGSAMRFLTIILCANGLFAQATYDLLLKGGHVIDPKNKISAVSDVAIKGGHIAAVQKDIAAAKARKVVDVSGLYVT